MFVLVFLKNEWSKKYPKNSHSGIDIVNQVPLKYW